MMTYTLTKEEAAMYDGTDEECGLLRRDLIRRFGRPCGGPVKVEVYHPEGFVVEAFSGGGEEV